MKKQNYILQNFRKHISFILILNLLFFSSGQAYIFSDCECHHSETKVVESTNYCDEVVEIEVEEASCCASELENVTVKFESTTPHTCVDCSTGCSIDENINYSSPTLFTNISFSLKKLDKIESEFIDSNSEILNTAEISSKLSNNQKDEIPRLFGKNLLIQTNTLKIPLILV